MFPIFIDLRDRLVVVIGGGPVGLRKADALLAAGARVRLVALDPRPADDSSDRLDWLAQPYHPDHLNDALLAVAAATPEVNRRVAADCKSRGLWVNVADDPTAGNFAFPATVRRGGFVLAVGTGGAAPALARRVRERLEAEFDAAFGEWVELLAELRPLVRAAIPDRHHRQAAYENLTDWRWLDRLRRVGRERVRSDLLAELRRWGGGGAI